MHPLAHDCIDAINRPLRCTCIPVYQWPSWCIHASMVLTGSLGWPSWPCLECSHTTHASLHASMLSSGSPGWHAETSLESTTRTHPWPPQCMLSSGLFRDARKPWSTCVHAASMHQCYYPARWCDPASGRGRVAVWLGAHAMLHA